MPPDLAPPFADDDFAVPDEVVLLFAEDFVPEPEPADLDPPEDLLLDDADLEPPPEELADLLPDEPALAPVDLFPAEDLPVLADFPPEAPVFAERDVPALELFFAADDLPLPDDPFEDLDDDDFADEAPDFELDVFADVDFAAPDFDEPDVDDPDFDVPVDFEDPDFEVDDFLVVGIIYFLRVLEQVIR